MENTFCSSGIPKNRLKRFVRLFFMFVVHTFSHKNDKVEKHPTDVKPGKIFVRKSKIIFYKADKIHMKVSTSFVHG